MLSRTVSHTAKFLLQKQSGVLSARLNLQQERNLNLQEYQSKELLRDAGVTVQDFIVADSMNQAKERLQNFQVDEYVIKAQILAGGRGKGSLSSGLQGGVKITTKPDEAVEYVNKMVGYNLVTKQTPKEGVPVSKVMIAQSVDIKTEKYCAILMDRDFGGPVIVASPAGGMDIEDVAEKTPHLIFKEGIDILKGIQPEQAKKIAKNLEFKDHLLDQAADQITKLYNLFLKVDATQIEINPISETACDKVFCIDAKLNFDDSAKFRQKDIFAMEESAESDPREVAAEEAGLNYIGMDGNIACLVNGAGLAMATMDIIKLHGGDPANFLDVGGSVQEKQVMQAFQIITEDPKVKAILVNVFAGIVDCATIAKGIQSAFSKLNLSVPMVVRLSGNNAEKAREILSQSGLPIITAEDLDDAAKKAVGCVTGN